MNEWNNCRDPHLREAARMKAGKGEPFTWKTKDGVDLKPREMGDGHLLNAHRMVVRRVKVLTLAGMNYIQPFEEWNDARDPWLVELDEAIESMAPALDAFRAEIKARELEPLEEIT